MKSVAAVGDGLVAVGSTAWTSTDGLTWRRVTSDAAVFSGYEITSVTAGGSGVVAVGAGEGAPAVWIAAPAD